MIIEKVVFSDFKRISEENEYYLLHFLNPGKEQGQLALRSIIDEPVKGSYNLLDNFFKHIQVPYFESYVKDSVDFLINLGVPAKNIWSDGKFNPLIIGFNKKRIVKGTYEYCYCVETLTEIIIKMNPKFIEDIKLD